MRVPRQRIEAAVRGAFRAAKRKPEPVSIVLVDDAEIRRLHAQFLGADRATDVMSFPCEDDFADTPGGLLGEVVASTQMAQRCAEKFGVPPSHELVLYVAHGTLHLLGFDDHDDADRAKMRAAERRALKAAGIARDVFAAGDRGE